MATAYKHIKTRPASCGEIREMLGSREDDDLVMSIRHIGPSPEEILQAFEWLDDDDYMGASLRRRMDNSICQVYDLLLHERSRLAEER